MRYTEDYDGEESLMKNLIAYKQRRAITYAALFFGHYSLQDINDFVRAKGIHVWQRGRLLSLA